MKEIEFDVSGAQLIYTEQKQRPYNPLHRQKPRYTKMLTALAAYLVLAVAFALVIPLAVDVHWSVPVLAWTVICFWIIGKRAVIWLVRLYQYKAPDRVRLKCVYYPSCSEYMILAVEKYGTVRGVCKGIARLLRCHAPNGGEDFP